MRPPIEEEIEAADVEVADGRQAAVALVSTRLAGNAVIRVVNRCNEAQDSGRLGESNSYSGGRVGRRADNTNDVLRVSVRFRVSGSDSA